MFRRARLLSLMILLCLLTIQSQARSGEDLATMLKLLDQDKLSALSEAKLLRETNATNTQQAALFDFGYGLMLVKFGRWQEAADVLKPFVEQRPQVYRARLLLVRAYVELDKFDDAINEFEKLLDKLPTEAEVAEDVARTTGIFVAYLEQARSDDCPEELRKRIAQSAETKLPEALKQKYKEGMSFVETQVAKLNNEIVRITEKAEEEAESKIASELESAERLKSEADAKAEELKSREKLRTEKLDKLKSDLQKLELATASNIASLNALDRQVHLMNQMQQNLVVEVVKEDSKGNPIRRREITDQVQYNRLGRDIANGLVERRTLEGQSRTLVDSYRQLQSQASGLMSQKEVDEMFTKSKMSDLNKAAESKQKKAEREAERKSKKTSAAARGLQNKIKSYSTYDSLDIAGNKEYLAGISKRYLTQN